LSRVSIRFWLRRFDVGGPAALYDAPRSGRPRSLDADDLQLLTRLIDTDPQHVDATTERTTWTMAMLTLALIMRLGRYVSRSTVCSAARRLGLRWGRPRLAMPQKVDPAKTQKQ